MAIAISNGCFISGRPAAASIRSAATRSQATTSTVISSPSMVISSWSDTDVHRLRVGVGLGGRGGGAAGDRLERRLAEDRQLDRRLGDLAGGAAERSGDDQHGGGGGHLAVLPGQLGGRLLAFVGHEEEREGGGGTEVPVLVVVELEGPVGLPHGLALAAQLVAGLHRGVR